MGHTVLIAAHTAVGLAAFAAGWLALTRRSYFTVYFWSLIFLVAFLAAVVAVDWAGLDSASRTVFAALTALGGYMIWRAVQARQLQQATSLQQRARRIDHIGFTLVALFDGFVIIAALDLGAPAWLAIVIAAAGIAAGHTTLRRLKRQLA